MYPRLGVLVCEDHYEDRVEWGLSFTNHNPEPQDYFGMQDKKTAFALADRINEHLELLNNVADGVLKKLNK